MSDRPDDDGGNDTAERGSDPDVASIMRAVRQLDPEQLEQLSGEWHKFATRLPPSARDVAARGHYPNSIVR